MHAAQLSPVHAAARWRGVRAPRAAVVQALQAEGIPCSSGYGFSLHRQPMFRQRAFGPYLQRVAAALDYDQVHCPHSDLICREQGVWLEHAMLLGGRSDMDDIVRAFEKIHENRHALLDWSRRTPTEAPDSSR